MSDRKHYVTNKDLLVAHAAAMRQKQLTPELAKMLSEIAERYSYHPWFKGYSFREDLVAEAKVVLVKNWHKFDASKGSNPFAFFTTTCYRAFQSYLADEKYEANVKDLLRVELGADPSWNFSQDLLDKNRADHARLEGSDNTAFRSVEQE